MAKYYIESGAFQTIVIAEQAHAAALWAMHLAMEETVPLDDLEACGQIADDLSFADSAAPFGMTMKVSEIGFSRAEAGEFSTLEVMTEWNQLTMAVCQFSQLVSKQPR